MDVKKHMFCAFSCLILYLYVIKSLNGVCVFYVKIETPIECDRKNKTLIQ
jgi:hypothetical protein